MSVCIELESTPYIVYIHTLRSYKLLPICNRVQVKLMSPPFFLLLQHYREIGHHSCAHGTPFKASRNRRRHSTCSPAQCVHFVPKTATVELDGIEIPFESRPARPSPDEVFMAAGWILGT